MVAFMSSDPATDVEMPSQFIDMGIHSIEYFSASLICPENGSNCRDEKLSFKPASASSASAYLSLGICEQLTAVIESP